MKYRILIFFAALCAGLMHLTHMSAADKWEISPEGLPYAKIEWNGDLVNDPSYLLGNYRVKVNAHASGIYELISGERIWARFNADPVRPDYGRNRAVAIVDGRETALVGAGSLAARKRCQMYAGVGFVRYDYDLGNGVKCSRMISVMPSENVNEGNPFFLVTVTFHNTGSGARKISYDEAIAPYFVPAAYQTIPEKERPLRYHMTTDISFRCITASFSPIQQDYVQYATAQQRALDEFAPQSVFLYCDDAFLVVNDGELKASIDDFRLRSGKKHTFSIVIGFGNADSKDLAEAAIKKAEDSRFGAFASMWKKKLPDFSSERKGEIRMEMYSRAHNAEAAAVYNDYFKETFIPGMSSYTYRFGENVSNRQHIQAALQACYTNPALARSIILYVLKQSSFDGMIPDSNKGFGYIPTSAYEENLIQLDVFNAIALYIEKTGDYDLLGEWITVYPMERGEMQSVMNIIEKYFIHLRDFSSDSPAKLAMQAACLPDFIAQLEKSGRASDYFMKALKKYAEESYSKFAASSDSGIAELPYILETETVANSVKRDLIEKAKDEGLLDMKSVPGLATFDGIEASSLFREMLFEEASDKHSTFDDAWSVYCYYRLME